MSTSNLPRSGSSKSSSSPTGQPGRPPPPPPHGADLPLLETSVSPAERLQDLPNFLKSPACPLMTTQALLDIFVQAWGWGGWWPAEAWVWSPGPPPLLSWNLSPSISHVRPAHSDWGQLRRVRSCRAKGWMAGGVVHLRQGPQK